ncbi:hypothetical protein KY289_030707 [Solanum tuberosum]|nr:hypothetical protein KY289_030707 [Solanum tuberosum]
MNKRKYPQLRSQSLNSPRPNMNNYSHIPQQRPSSLLHDRHKWGEHNDNHPKSQLLGLAYQGGYEVGNGQLCEPPLDGKCVVPLAPAVAPSLFHNMKTQWGLPPHFNPPMNSNSPPQLLFFTPQEAIDNNPLFFPCVPVPLQGHAAQQAGSSQQPPLWQAGSEREEEVLRNSFTEISTLRHVALILFSEKEDKKYIHMCPVALAKCSFDLRSAVNTALICSPQHYYPVVFPQGRSSDRESLIHLLSND